MKQFISIYIILFLTLKVVAQDPHFSQFSEVPLTLNPALTGRFDQTARASLQYRSQWLGIGNPYITGYGAFETQILKSFIQQNKLSYGVMGIFDKTAGGGLMSNYLAMSLGYHLYVNEDETSQLSAGFQTTYVSKRLDYSNLSFEDQFSSGGFNTLLPSNQNFNTGSIGYIDMNTGIAFQHINDNNSFDVGASLYHITRPTESFLGTDGMKVNSRINIHAGGSFYTNDNDVVFINTLLMHQGNSNQYMLGCLYEKVVVNAQQDISVGIGLYYRLKESYIPTFQLKYNQFKLGISYDVVTSKVSLGNTKAHSFELCLKSLF